MAKSELKHIYRDTCEKFGCGKKLSKEEILECEKLGLPALCSEHLEWIKESYQKCANLMTKNKYF